MAWSRTLLWQLACAARGFNRHGPGYRRDFCNYPITCFHKTRSGVAIGACISAPGCCAGSASCGDCSGDDSSARPFWHAALKVDLKRRHLQRAACRNRLAGLTCQALRRRQVGKRDCRGRNRHPGGFTALAQGRITLMSAGVADLPRQLRGRVEYLTKPLSTSMNSPVVLRAPAQSQ